MSKKVFIIVNPGAGKEEPAAEMINEALKDVDFKYELKETKTGDDAFNFTKEAIKKDFDLIAVYGGDGTVTEVARALYLNKTPLLIIPGGTANVLAKELKLPEDSASAINMLKQKDHNIKPVDMALLGDRPFILRLNIGILADMVKSADRGLKDIFGKAAYSLTAFKHINKYTIYDFKMEIDGEKIEDYGVAMMIANSGNIGMKGHSIVPNVYISDGFLDVVLFKNATAESLFDWLKSFISRKKPEGSVKHWKAKNILITCTPATKIICDDIPLLVKTIKVKVVPKAINIVIS